MITIFIDRRPVAWHFRGRHNVWSRFRWGRCEDIKITGGIAVAQAPDSAVAEAMPLNAIQTGEVDYVLPPEEIGSLLGRICRKSHGFTA
ncbi:MAG: hypothetical protein JO266_12940 [Acidobacteria bacterium]|nr:hypothetical protein [Acidobacteriota bacterium]